jgi:hypothetical protein
LAPACLPPREPWDAVCSATQHELSLANPIIFDRIRAARLSRHGRKTKSLPGAPFMRAFAHE